MRSEKVLNEEIEELDLEVDRNRYGARAIFNNCKKAKRDLTNGEFVSFDEMAAKVPELKAQRAQLERELATAQQRKRQVLAMSRTPSFYSPTAHNDGSSPRRVLPVNGEFEDEPRRPQAHHRIGKLKCFSDPRDAFDSGMVLRSIVAHTSHRRDDVADDYCQSRLGWSVTNAASEGTGTGGGYTVPSPLSNAIIDIREKAGTMRKLVRKLPMTSDTLSIPKRAGGLTAYYVEELNAMTLSDKLWSQVSLIAKKRAVAHQISQELQDDSLIAVVDDAVNEMSYALADKEDAEMISGDGTSIYGLTTGLKTAIGSAGISTAATGHDTWPELDLADFTAAMGLLPDRFHAGGPAFVCSSSFYFSVMLRIHAAAGGNTISSLQGGDGGARQFLGYPVYTTQYMPTTTAVSTVCCFFGTFWMGVILGERMGVRVARSDDYAFLNDVTTLKATTRYDFNIHEPGTASLPGSYVGLKTAS